MLANVTPVLPGPRSAPPTLDGLMARHDRLVHAVVRRQGSGGLSYTERLQAGRIGLWHALQGYDPSRGIAFSTYAWPAIAHQVWRAVQEATPRRAPSPPPTARPADPEEVVVQHEVALALATLVRHLPGPLRQVVVGYYGLMGERPCSLRQLGRQLGVSHETVRLRLWAALVWLRQPAHSLTLRQLLDANTAAAYAWADERAQPWLRRRGGRDGRCR